jgi:hypothetical protein
MNSTQPTALDEIDEIIKILVVITKKVKHNNSD